MRNAYLQMCDFGSRFRILKGGKISLVVSAFIASVTLLQAAPTGGVVTSGTASIAQSGSVTNITQTTQKAAINWQNFSIGASEVVNFNQPNVSAITLNRVVGNEKSIIDGALNANGQVFILNSNGLLFSKNASINTAGLVATTMNLSDTDFMNGNYAFKGDSTASIINQGTINISDKGYAALFGKAVSNEGIIKATLGKVHLTGASELTLNLNGNSLVNLTVTKGVLDALVENKGAIYADGGQVYLTTNAVNELLKGVVNNTGIIEAQTLDDITGKIELYAHGGALHVEGTLEAKGGFIETSGKTLSVADGTVIKAKKWLIDPTDVVIESTGNSDLAGSSISAGAIETAFGTVTDIEIQATNNITVNEAININAGTQAVNTLTLTAGHDININAPITVGSDSALYLNHGWNGDVSTPLYDNAIGTITMGMNVAKTAFVGKVIFETNGGMETNSLWINDAQYTIIRDTSALADLNTNDMNGNYVLGSDLNMNGVTFTPIGYNLGDNNDNYTNEFKGKFNGLGNTISNLTISKAYNWDDDSDFKATGLFGNVSGGALINNVRLSNATVTNTAAASYATEVGALVGYARGEYDTNDDFVAAPTIHNNIVTGSTITSNGWNVGGIVGGAEDNVVLSNNAVTSTIVASAEKGYVGGIAGYVNQNVTINNAYVSDSTITAGGAEAAGAISGSLEGQSELKNSYAQANTITAKRDVGGLVGLIDDFGDEYKKPSTITNSFYKLDDTSINGTVGVITYGGIYANQATAWLAGNKADLNLGDASSGFYTIDSTQDLKDMLGLVYNQANKFKLSTNLSLVAGWYLPALTGTFDGNGHTLSGLNVNQDYNANIGFVGRLLGGTVKNLTIAGATLNGYANVGGIAGMMRGNTFVLDAGSTDNGSFTDGATITNVHVTGLNYNIDKTFDATWNAMDNGVSYDSIGGLVGTAQSKSIISNSDSAGNITINIKSNGFSDYVGASSIGGLVGSARGDDITFDHVSSSVGITLKATALVANSDIGFENIGGLVGSMGGDHTNAILSNASATGAISITTQNFSDTGGNDYNIAEVGGLVGYADGLDATTISATNTINVKGDYIEYVGGIVGESYDSNYAGVTRSGAITINPADVTTNQYSQVYSVGGLIGYSEEDTITNATASGTITLRTADAPIHYAEYIGGAIGQTYGTNIDTVTSSVSITATNVEEGESFGGLVGYNSGYNDDISKDRYQITFHGADLTTQYNNAKTAYLARADVKALLAQGYELYDGSDDGITSSNPYYDIYFELVKRNVELGNISNSNASGNVIAPNVSNVGGLVGYNYLYGDSGATITNSHASGEVQGMDNVGGLVGYNYGGNIATSYATGKVTGTGEYIGGLVGYNYGSDDDTATISDSYATGEVVGHGASYVGGLVGENYNDADTGATISNSYATGAVKADNAEYVGGLIGYNEYALIDTSYATGAVTAANSVNVGGLVGYAYEDNIANSYATGKVTVTNSGDASYVGGLIGYSESSSISNSYATGEVSAIGVDNVGGLIGYAQSTDMQYTYATGKVTGYSSVGGLVGHTDNSWIEQSYAKGSITGNDNVGGLVGYLSDGKEAIVDSYAVGNVTGIENVGGLVGGTTGTIITNTYASGIVTGTTNVGGLVGLNEDSGNGLTTVNASFYNSTKNATLTDNASNVGKTTTELNTLSTFVDAGWEIAEDTSLIYMYPQFSPINIRARMVAQTWVLNPAATIDPTSGGTVTPPTQNLEPIVSQIVNSVIQPPVIPNFTPPTPPAQAPQQFSFGGQMVQLMSTPSGGTPTQVVSMQEIRQMQQEGGGNGGNPSGDIRVPLMAGSLIDLVNGGVRLPNGVEQEFFMAQR